MPFNKSFSKFDIKVQIMNYIQIRDLPFLSECIAGGETCFTNRGIGVSSQTISYYLNIICCVWFKNF